MESNMKSRTVVCVYGKNEPIERVMERLNAMYVSNYSKNYVYGALIDLPDAISYRVSGDQQTEEKAQELVKMLSARYGSAFFCAIRQRRIRSDREYRYACEDGVLGAIKALWRYVKGKGTELFPVFGCGGMNGAERIYFSAEVRKDTGVHNEFIDVIEPNGIFRLAAHLRGNEAVFAFTGAFDGDKSGCDENKTEVLFSAAALDKLLSCEPVPYKSVTCAHIGMVRYPASSFGVFAGEILLL